MSEPPNNTDAAVAAAEDRSPESSRSDGRLVDALAAVQGTYESSRVYGADHPAVIRSADEAADRLRAHAEGGRPLIVGVSSDRLLNDLLGEQDSDPLRDFAKRLHERNIGAIQVTAAVTREAVLALAGLLRQRGSTEDLVSAVARETNGSITMVPMSYHRVQAGSGDPSEAAPTWSDLARTLLSPAGQTPEALARAVTEASAEGNHAPLREQLHQLTADLQTLDPGERRRTVRRLTRFLVGLNPDLRRALLAVEPKDLDQSVAVLDLLVAVMPIDEVLGALEALDDTDARPSKEAVRLYTKLARIAHRVPAHTPRIERLFSRSGVEHLMEVDSETHEIVRRTVQETLTSDSRADFNPEDYDAALDVLCGFTAGAESGAALREIDAGEVRALVARTALDLLALDDEALAPVLDGPFRLLAAASRSLVELDRAGLVLEGVRAARSAVTAPVTVSQRVAATEFLDALRRRDFAHAVLDRCTDPEADLESIREECLELLRLGEAPAIAALLLRPSSRASALILADLQEMAGERLGEVLRDAVRLLTDDGEDGLAALQSLLDMIRDDRLSALLESLASDLDPALRCVPFRAMTGDAAVHLPCRIIQRGLFDRERLIRELAAERLAERTDEAAVEATVNALTSEIDGDLAHRVPEIEVYDRLLEALSRRPDAVTHLSRVTNRLSWTASSTLAAFSWRALKHLWRLRRQRGARWAVLRWWVSPASALLCLDLFNRPLWRKNV